MDANEKIRIYISILGCVFIAYGSYSLGYMDGRDDYQVKINYRCHDEVVYRWTGNYWDNMKQPCKTDDQIKSKS